MSQKTIHRLEAAERAAGIGEASAASPRQSGETSATPSRRHTLPLSRETPDDIETILDGLSPEVRPAVQAIHQLLAAHTAALESRFDAIESRLNAPQKTVKTEKG